MATKKATKPPAKKTSTRTALNKPAPKKTAAKRAAKKSTPKNRATKSSTPRELARKKSAPKKAVARKSAPTKSAPNKIAARKKSTPTNRVTKKSAVTKSATKKSAKPTRPAKKSPASETKRPPKRATSARPRSKSTPAATANQRGGVPALATANLTNVEKAYREFIDALAVVDSRWREPGVLDDEQTRLDGYRWAMSMMQIASDVFIHADANRPRFVDIVGPYKKFNGDNADAAYMFAPINAHRSYKVTGRRGDTSYFSLTIYGTALDSPKDRLIHTDRIVAILNDRDIMLNADGSFEILLAPTKPDDYSGNFVQLTAESVCAITRDYMNDQRTARRVTWKIEALDPPPRFRDSDAALAGRFRAAARWVNEHTESFPAKLSEFNTVSAPFPVPKVTTGWAAGDAAYAMGAFRLADDEALVITGRSPECRFWNLNLWNPFIATYNYDYDERVAINGTQVSYEPDGSWTLVVSERDPHHPNWLCPAGHKQGRLFFRWFYPATVPDPLQTRVVKIRDVPSF